MARVFVRQSVDSRLKDAIAQLRASGKAFTRGQVFSVAGVSPSTIYHGDPYRQDWLNAEIERARVNAIERAIAELQESGFPFAIADVCDIA